ncbi:PPIC-type PPIASE domain-containing protein [Thiothrix caldifontis]|uniref:PPIC-type PPIASE domain-containing protein n=1 Tax=Thiothrix caldifontis TaxID=525918 RepID=A0A1H3VHC8_9GAMM|nr:peptidylprolyl isomerase [Thiothrix caldifontis]SDZ74140.1 PPIC-type PPIASE domain-containing protein [Thiothrix caldifontis]
MLRYLTFALLYACAFPALAADDTALSETTYIRNTLIQQGLERGLDKSPELEKLVTEFRNDQLARLALDAAREEGMPDFTARAEELYQARQEKQYQLPLRLRVRVLEMAVKEGDATAIRDKLNGIRAEVAAGKTDFKAAVMAHSDAVDLKLTEGDSQWFQQGQRPDVFFQAAEKLSANKPLSEVFIHNHKAYLLAFLDRKAPETRTFAEVKSEIMTELQQEYRTDREKMLLESLSTAFKSQQAAR